MNAVCSDKSFDGGTCESVCESLPDNIRGCRTYHCGLATINNPMMHCMHAVGIGLCRNSRLRSRPPPEGGFATPSPLTHRPPNQRAISVPIPASVKISSSTA